jgi:hypothetical protein
MGYWKHIDPVGAIADFRTVFQQAGRHRWRIGAAAAATTFAIFGMIFQEEYRIEPRRPTVTYISSFAPDRTDEEIIASNRANEQRQALLRAEQAKRDEEVREVYRTLGRMSGMDVEAIERKAAEERAAERRAGSARAAEQQRSQLER